MRIEFIVPIVMGVLLGLVGLALLLDAWTADEMLAGRERRRRPRAERHRGGEAFVGLGVIGMAAAFIGRDVWRYRTVSVLAGLVLLILGAILNRRFLGELITNRGALRRGAPQLDSSVPPEQPVPPSSAAPEHPSDRLRIR